MARLRAAVVGVGGAEVVEEERAAAEGVELAEAMGLAEAKVEGILREGS